MTIAPISFACRVFLSRNHVYPVWLHQQFLKSLPPDYRRTPNRIQLQGRHWSCFIPGGNEIYEAFVEIDQRSGNLLLKAKRQRFWYREHRDGTADLILFDHHVPDVLCIGLDKDRYRLTQLVEHSFDPFYLSSDPIVRSMRNGQRLGRQALVLKLLPTWSAAHWDYRSDGMWRE